MTNQNDLYPFLDKEYRDSYIDTYVKGGIAYQIQSLREKYKLSQKEFGDKIGKTQSVVSRLEDTEYGAVSINTLLDVAKALDVALEVRFSDYVSVIKSDVSFDSLKPDNIYESYQKSSISTAVTIDAVSTVTQVMSAHSAAIAGPVFSGGTNLWPTTLPQQSTSPKFQGSATLNIGNYIPMQF